MPRMVRAAETKYLGELEVSWATSESGLICIIDTLNVDYRVILHRASTCWLAERTRLLYDNAQGPSLNDSSDKTAQCIAPCGCPQKIVPRVAGRTVFTGLNIFDLHFPMIARNIPRSIFVHPPPPIRPKVDGPLRATVVVPRVLPDAGPASTELENTIGDNNLYRNPTPVTRPGPSSQQPTVTFCINEAQSSATSNGKLHTPSNSMLTDDVFRSSWQREMELWKSWHEQNLQKAFEQFIPKRVVEERMGTSFTSSLVCRHLGYTFERGEYVHIQVPSPHGVGEVQENVVFIHDIACSGQTKEDKAYYLLVSKYSFLGSSPPFNRYQCVGENAKRISERELLLHFGDFRTMGERQDAEFIRVGNIRHARDVEMEDAVEHLVQMPRDNKYVLLGFARRTGLFEPVGSSTLVAQQALTIAASSVALLFVAYRNRWKSPKFKFPCKPAAFDLTPSVLGPSEGFSQVSCQIYAAFRFGEKHDMTWRVRHHAAAVYDESTTEVLADFGSGRLVPPCLPGPEIPKIALISGMNFKFILDDMTNAQRRNYSIRDFLVPLRILDDAVTSSALIPRSSDFFVLALPSAILHEIVFPELIGSIMKILERRYSVHLKMSSFSEHNIPQSRTVIILLASPICADPHWDLYWPPEANLSQASPETTVRHKIRDLFSQNSRMKLDGKPCFVCNYQPVMEYDPLGCIYNHGTGQKFAQMEPIELETANSSLDYRRLRYQHPVRGDCLTVRELARMQGFADNFIFYGSDVVQYTQVLNAIPPPVAKRIANTIIQIIQNCRVAQLEEGTNEVEIDARGAKRPRVDT
ncbi:hypothetical protein AOQ84DRAFT_373147 [Glonium stellatum]|uniref:DNA (cytosine-5-)-methyltransferase n=1 Tax=Glonium stellatum TaxID=574774 RepID=A0A8E2F9I2_9PEZI|nr:hypothetical protein AOQ84DRAFT_373147 [Glonium stellatum]